MGGRTPGPKLCAMKKSLAVEVATLSGGEASGFGNRGELEADLGTLAKLSEAGIR